MLNFVLNIFLRIEKFILSKIKIKYDPERDSWWPKCKDCKGQRDKYCPKECFGDIE